ncbi:unnamed protein product [Blepharisma stoltei]|uniref:Uncharacterized protein n=1 Tax=Blepharisma stoltei TaxID=1481888 RepID=A0AAU9K071_9CILI|nr:unnamed protein product [Blepharisma stoltei]
MQNMKRSSENLSKSKKPRPDMVKSYLKKDPVLNLDNAPDIVKKAMGSDKIISDKLKETYKGQESISLDDSYDSDSKKPWLNAKPPQKSRELVLTVKSHASEPAKRILPDFNILQKAKKDDEDISLNKLLQWNKQLESQKTLPEIPKKREKTDAPEPRKISKQDKKVAFKVNDFVKEETERKIQEQAKEAEDAENARLSQKEKDFNNAMKYLQKSQNMTPEEQEAQARTARYHNRLVISEFYNFVLSLDLTNPDPPPLARKAIPIGFKNGKYYREFFLPAFFDELRADIFCALNQNDMSSQSIIELRLHSLQQEYAIVVPGDEKSGNVSFYKSIKQDDLVIIIPCSTKVDIPPRFSEWNSEKVPEYYLGVCERENRGCSWLLKVKNDFAQKLERPEIFIVIYAESLTSLMREFKMIKLAEFLDIGEFIMNPSMKGIWFAPDLTNGYIKMIEDRYNSSQSEAIQKVCSQNTGITLLQGPPGTGKTHTLLGIMSSFLLIRAPNNERPRLLVCAPSNAAIDELACRTVKQGLFGDDGKKRHDLLFVRLGHVNLQHLELRQKNPNDTRETPKEVKKITVEYLLSEKFKKQGLTAPQVNIDQWKNELNKVDAALVKAKTKGDKSVLVQLEEKRREVQNNLFREKGIKAKFKERKKEYEMDLLEKADIIFCTLSTAGSKEMQGLKNKFTCVLIDEACQSVELSTLIPLQYGAKHVVLVGDPRQLPSTTFNKHSPKVLYNRSLFERLMEGGTEVIMLEIQYRMTPEICWFSSEFFYESRLQNAPEVLTRPRPNWMPHIDVMFFDLKTSNESKSQEETSLFNKPEADFIVQIYEKFSNWHQSRLNIGIVTPYRRQVKLIREILYKKYQGLWRKDIEINTVDGFQGREKDLILFSSVRSGDSVGFLADYRRMNVAITRAKFGLWIVGKADCLKRNEFWGKFIDSLRKDRCVECNMLEEVERVLIPCNAAQDVIEIESDKMEIEEEEGEIQNMIIEAPEIKEETKKRTEKRANELIKASALDIINRS